MCQAISVKQFEPRHWRKGRVMCAGAALPNCFPRVSPRDCVGRSGIRGLTTRDYGKTSIGARRRRTYGQGGEDVSGVKFNYCCARNGATTTFTADVPPCLDWTRKRLDEKWTQTPCKANICHCWRVDGVLIRAQGYKSFEPIHPNWAVAGRRWNQSAVASSEDKHFLSAGMCDSPNQQHRCCVREGRKKKTKHILSSLKDAAMKKKKKNNRLSLV